MAKRKPTTKSLLTSKEIKHFIKHHPDWTLNTATNILKREYKIKSYIEALTLLARVVVHVEIANHHPEVNLSYGKISFKLTTHDQNGLTKLDTDLADKIETILQR